MGLGTLVGKVIKSVGKTTVKSGRTLQYGSQVGKMSKNGLVCHGKKIKGGMQYTTLNASTDEVVRTKSIFTEQGFKQGCTVENGNTVSTFSISEKPYYYHTHNKFAKEARIIREDFNNYGQVTHKSDVSWHPASKPGWLEMNDKCVYVG